MGAVMPGTLDRRTVLKLGVATAWAVPAIQSVQVVEAVGSAAPASGGEFPSVVGGRLVLAAGSLIVTWRTADGTPAGPVPRSIAPTVIAPPKPFGARAVLAADSTGLFPGAWPGVCATNLFGGPGLVPNTAAPLDITAGRWSTAGSPLFTFYVRPTGDAAEETFTWADVWCVFLRP